MMEGCRVHIRIAATVLMVLLTWGPGMSQDITEILARAPILNPNLSAFPDSSMLDRSGTLEAPAGKRGFVSVKDGHFAFADGTRARFFGVNLAKTSVFLDKARIEELADLFARAGINLVRIHHIDDTEGILDPDPARYFRPEQLDCVDYWVAQLRKRGIYLCLDLNDYRTFRAADGVQDGEALGRGAKPYAVFDPRLIELQQAYARKLLVEHVNPYTKLPYAKDPAVAFLEIYDENGLFIRRGDWPTLREPYKTTLAQGWNAWLRVRYGTTAALKEAWTNRTGYCALQPGERLEQATVRLPTLALGTTVPLSGPSALTAPARVHDGVQYAYAVQTTYLSSMTAALREMGVSIPLTAVGAQDLLPDLLATARTTDYIGINYYWDHPTWPAGRDWTMPSYFSLKNPLSQNLEYSFPAIVSLARMHKKPLVVRELGYCYPNPYRGVGMLEAAAYGAFLDLDALIMFTYDAHTQARTIGYFDIHLDPIRWGVVGQCARLFRSDAVRPSICQVGIGYSEVDAFTWYTYQSPLYQLGLTTRVCNYTTGETPHPFDLLIASGRSRGAQWAGDRLLLFANNSHADLHLKTVGGSLEKRHGYTLQDGAAGSFPFIFRGVGFNDGEKKEASAFPAFLVKDLEAQGLFPIAATPDGQAFGFADPLRRNLGFRTMKETWTPRIVLDTLREWSGALTSHQDLDRGAYNADTGQIRRDARAGTLLIDTPTFQGFAGQFTAPLRTDTVSLRTTTKIGTLCVESLDGKPLVESARYLVKMTSRARNDQTTIAATAGGPKPHRLSALGTAPIITDGTTTGTTTITLDGAPLIELGLQEGCWEYLVEPARALLYLDTANVRVTLPVKPRLLRWHSPGRRMDVTPDSATFTVPGGVSFVEIIR